MRGCGRGVELGRVGAGHHGPSEGRDVKESHDFCFLCVDLHAISNTPFLAGFLRGKRKKLKKMKSDNCDYVTSSPGVFLSFVFSNLDPADFLRLGFLSFFPSSFSKTQPNHWTKRMTSTD